MLLCAFDILRLSLSILWLSGPLCHCAPFHSYSSLISLLYLFIVVGTRWPSLNFVVDTLMVFKRGFVFHLLQKRRRRSIAWRKEEHFKFISLLMTEKKKRKAAMRLARRAWLSYLSYSMPSLHLFRTLAFNISYVFLTFYGYIDTSSLWCACCVSPGTVSLLPVLSMSSHICLILFVTFAHIWILPSDTCLLIFSISCWALFHSSSVSAFLSLFSFCSVWWHSPSHLFTFLQRDIWPLLFREEEGDLYKQEKETLLFRDLFTVQTFSSLFSLVLSLRCDSLYVLVRYFISQACLLCFSPKQFSCLKKRTPCLRTGVGPDCHCYFVLSFSSCIAPRHCQ